MQLKINYEAGNLPFPDLETIPDTEPTQIKNITLEAPIITIDRLDGGIVEIHLTKTKVCPRCGRDLPPSEFFKKKTAKDGLQSYCKDDARKAKNELYAKRKQKKST